MASLQVPGGELYYEVAGEEAPVVLVHGLALDTRMWDDQVPALAEVATVVRYDVRGFGRSTRDARTPYSNAGGVVRWRSPTRIRHGTWFVQVTGLATGAAAACPPDQSNCNERWSNVRRITVRKPS